MCLWLVFFLVHVNVSVCVCVGECVRLSDRLINWWNRCSGYRKSPLSLRRGRRNRCLLLQKRHGRTQHADTLRRYRPPQLPHHTHVVLVTAYTWKKRKTHTQTHVDTAAWGTAGSHLLWSTTHCPLASPCHMTGTYQCLAYRCYAISFSLSLSRDCLSSKSSRKSQCLYILLHLTF